VQRGGNAEPCAVLVLQPEFAHDVGDAAAQAIAHANQKLSSHQRIRHWLIWPDSDFPRTSTQKPRQDLIFAYAHAQVERSGNGNVPRSAVQQALVGLKKSGEGSSVKLDDDLNLSSIDRVELLTALEQRYQVELDEGRFSEATTVGDVERMLNEASQAPRSRKYHYPRWSQRWLVRCLRITIYYLFTWPATLIMAKPRVVGSQRLKSHSSPLLFISNHVTYIDAGLLMFAMPAKYRHKLAIAMQGELLAEMRNPPKQMNVFRRAIEVLSYWLVTALFDVFPLPQRSGFRESFAFAGESIDRGYSVLVFPEGRRTTDGEMSPFRAGIGILAQQLKVPVVPMRINGLFPLKTEQRHFARRGEIKVIVGEPEEFPETMSEEEIARALEERVKSLSA
jgi:long-chain acyl-CoA synthetase